MMTRNAKQIATAARRGPASMAQIISRITQRNRVSSTKVISFATQNPVPSFRQMLQ
jgi:hypothetical protein